MENAKNTLKVIETVYCLVVVGLVLGLMATVTHKYTITEVLGVSLCAMCPIGIVMECAYARFPIPWPVLGCIFLTGVWTIVVIKSNM